MVLKLILLHSYFGRFTFFGPLFEGPIIAEVIPNFICVAFFDANRAVKTLVSIRNILFFNNHWICF